MPSAFLLNHTPSFWFTCEVCWPFPSLLRPVPPLLPPPLPSPVWSILARTPILRHVLDTGLTDDVAAPHKLAVTGGGDGYHLLNVLPAAAELLAGREILSHGGSLHLPTLLKVQHGLWEALAVLGEVLLLGAIVSGLFQIDERVLRGEDVCVELGVKVVEQGGAVAVGVHFHLEGVVIFDFEDVPNLVVGGEFSPAGPDSTGA